MKERILNGWSFIRIIYIVMGVLVMYQSAIMHEWIGFAFGCYFASMGLFRFGCAAGNCATGNTFQTSNKNQSVLTQDITYEEIK